MVLGGEVGGIARRIQAGSNVQRSGHPCMHLLQLGTLGGVIEAPSAAWRALMRKQYSTAAHMCKSFGRLFAALHQAILSAARSQEQSWRV